MEKPKKETAIKPRLLPQSLEAEQSVLGCLIIDKNVAPTIFGILEKTDFYSEAHAIIFDAMKELFLKNQPIDYVTLTNGLMSSGQLEKVGDLDYISDLTRILPSAANFETYMNIVRDKAVMRKLISASQEMINIGFESADAGAAIAAAEKTFYSLSTEQDISTLKQLSGSLGGVIEKFETIHNNPGSLVGLQTGFARLDKLTNGFQKGDLIILAARPGIGKTSLAMNIVCNVALDGKTAAVFSLEMPREQLAQRMLCSAASVPMNNALDGKLTNKEWSALFAAKQKLGKTHIYVDDSSLITADRILSKCRRMQREHGLDLIMIDYLQLMTSDRRNRDSNRQNEVAEISRMLKILAKELNVPVLVLSQMSRSVESRVSTGHKPVLSDLRESGAIEQDADIVMFIHKRDRYEDIETADADQGIVELIVAKHRNGALDDIKLRWIGEIVSFKNLDSDANLASVLKSAPQSAGKKGMGSGAGGGAVATETGHPSDADAPPENPLDRSGDMFLE